MWISHTFSQIRSVTNFLPITNLEFFRKKLGLGVPEKDHSCIHQIFFATTHSSTPVFFNVSPSNYELSLVSLFATIIRFQTLSMKSKFSIGSKIRSKMFVCCFEMLLNLLWRALGDHPFRTCPKYSEKLTFLISIDDH